MSHRSGLLITTFLLAGIAATPALAQDPQAKLWDASIAGDTAAISQALAAGAKVDSLDTRTNRNGRMPLNWAAFNNRVDAVRLLLAKGAPINGINRTGFTPLHHAAEAGALEALKVLLEAGADASIPNLQGNLPIDTARAQGHAHAVQVLEGAAKKP
jgi:ankyrin repeat protein